MLVGCHEIEAHVERIGGGLYRDVVAPDSKMRHVPHEAHVLDWHKRAVAIGVCF
jgi:hypothetical protein